MAKDLYEIGGLWTTVLFEIENWLKNNKATIFFWKTLYTQKTDTQLQFKHRLHT